MTMQLVCPLCRAPLPSLAGGRADAVLTCGQCAAEVDVSRAGTGAGRPRFLAELDRTGQAVDGIRLEARIGMGGMGTVYRGRHLGDGPAAAGTPVAVKFLTPALAGDPDVVARFEREMQVLRGLQHPGIVRLHAHGTSDGIPWFAMELVDGPDLKARLRAGPLERAELVRVFARLLEALEHAHARGVVHRDIKPGNVLLHDEGAKLADFGVALAVDAAAAAATRLTETAAIIGTLPYMSPEQRAGRALDRRSDLFSVGVVLYEAATGALPLGAFPPPSRANRALPAAFDRVVHRLLQPQPDARYTSAAQAGRALVAALRERSPARRFVLAGAVTTLVTAVGLGIPAISHRAGQQAADQAHAALEENRPTAGIRVERATATPPSVNAAPQPPAPAVGLPLDAKSKAATAPKTGKREPAAKTKPFPSKLGGKKGAPKSIGSMDLGLDKGM
jgi:hypothetical protein